MGFTPSQNLSRSTQEGAKGFFNRLGYSPKFSVGISGDPIPLSFSFSYSPTLIVWGLRSRSGVSPTFDELGCHAHTTAPCSGRVRAWLWSATMTVIRG